MHKVHGEHSNFQMFLYIYFALKPAKGANYIYLADITATICRMLKCSNGVFFVILVAANLQKILDNPDQKGIVFALVSLQWAYVSYCIIL